MLLADKDGATGLAVASAGVVVAGVRTSRGPGPRLPLRVTEVVVRAPIQAAESHAEAVVHSAAVVIVVVTAGRPATVAYDKEVSRVVAVRVALLVCQAIGLACASDIRAAIR